VNHSGVVISLCDRTGNMVKPWAEAGYECWCIDTQHSIRRLRTEGNINYCWGDVRSWCPPEHLAGRIEMVFAFPPCTHVAVSGARDFETKGTPLLEDSLRMFTACQHAARWAGVPYMIENPVGVFSSHIAKPTHVFQPWEFGEDYTKRTCLWTGYGYVQPETYIHEKPPHIRQTIWEMPPSEDRADIRSITPEKFARAVFESNARVAARTGREVAGA
jgi:hypothetical protein